MIDANELLDLWLVPYHGLTYKQVEESHPGWMENPEDHSRDFYQKYAVTQEQHDEWYEKAIDLLLKNAGHSDRERMKRQFSLAYLNVAPSVKK